MKNIFFATIFSVSTYQYTSVLASLPLSYWLHYTQKPFVFRALIPLLGDSPIGILVVTALFGIGLGLAMIYAYKRYWVQSLRNDISLIISFSLVTLIITRYSNYYDFASAFFMLVMLLLWMEKKTLIFLLVFALASLNRETAILIVPVLFLFRRSNALWVSILLFALIRFTLADVYADAGGQAMYVQVAKNISIHLKYWYVSIILLSFSLYLAVIVFRKALTIRPEIFLYITIITPSLFAIYIVFGYAFEIRVFAEVLPMLFMSAFMKNE